MQAVKALEKPVVLDPRSLEPLAKPKKTWGAIPQVKPQPLNLHPKRVPATPAASAMPAAPVASRCEAWG